MRRRVALQTASFFPVLAVAEAAFAFSAPITDNPTSNYTAQIATGDYSQVQSYSEIIGLNVNTLQTEPDLYWFKYVSDGKSEVTFDTLGSDFGTNGPGGGTSGGTVLGSYNQSQIGVYTATGAPVAISKGTSDINGNPITIYPNFSTDPTKWYYPEGLSQLTFEPNAPTNPHWNVSPTDPTPFTGWAAPGNSGNSQKYYPPDYYTALNEYQVWNTALSTVVLDKNGNPVIDPSTGQPYQQPGWRYFDYARVGPGSSWNRYNVLPAGTYYIAVSSAGPVLSGDLPTEKVLEYPVWYDESTQQNNVPQLSGDMGPWQYYDDANGGPSYYGTIQLNVTETLLPALITWNNTGATGDGKSWDNGTSQNWNDGTNPATFSAGADITFNDNNNGHFAVTLNGNVAPGSVFFNNSTGNYTIGGTGSITGSGNLDKNGTGTVTLSTVNSYTGGTQVDGGVLVVGVSGALPANQALEIHNAGVLRLGTNSGATVLSSLYISSGATLDVGNNHVFINYGSTFDTFTTIVSELAIGINGGAWNGTGISSSAANANHSYGVAAIDGADLAHTAISSGTIEIAYALYGDINLDGVVNGSDFAILAAHFGQSVTGGWEQGDLNYDGNVNGADFALLAGNFGKAASGADVVLPSSEWASLDAFAAAHGLMADVPEPSSLLCMSALVGVLASRRRSIDRR
jgi:autotransporter-associated beta strand protein